MGGASVEDGRIKELFKQALLEVLQERRDLIYDLFAEVMEDLALNKAIQEGESSEQVTKDEVLKAIEGRT